MKVKNTHKVPLPQWRRWASPERSLFNAVYEEMVGNMRDYLHPKQSPPRAAHWNTTAWNAAFTAAEALRRQRLPLEEELRSLEDQ